MELIRIIDFSYQKAFATTVVTKGGTRGNFLGTFSQTWSANGGPSEAHAGKTKCLKLQQKRKPSEITSTDPSYKYS